MRIQKVILLCLLFVIGLCACNSTSKVKTREVASSVYSSKDISDAISVTTKYVSENWKGCKLLELYYSGDEDLAKYQDWADRNNADEVIVIRGSFSTDANGGDGSLKPNFTYDDNWMWILTRVSGGKWKYTDTGHYES